MWCKNDCTLGGIKMKQIICGGILTFMGGVIVLLMSLIDNKVNRYSTLLSIFGGILLLLTSIILIISYFIM